MSEPSVKKARIDENGSSSSNSNSNSNGNDNGAAQIEKELPLEVEEREEELSKQRNLGNDERGMNCPYLDTVKRYMLDFDFEKLCSVSLSNHNVYACLICGKYYQGRGKNSYAYLHSIHEDHHVFINLQTLKVYCLPDGYEVVDSSLNDIKYVLKPTFADEELQALDKNVKLAYDLNGKAYLPGFIGLNNMKANDYVNVVVQALGHIEPIRNFFIKEENYANSRSPLAVAFGELIRKMWNPKAFKGQVSPHELIQAISNASDKAFKPGVQSDASDFLSWFLNRLHLELGGTKKPNSSVVYKTFQGKVKVVTQPLIVDTSEEGEKGLKSESQMEEEKKHQRDNTVTEEMPYLFLTLELPPPPLFKSELEKNIIPQIPLQTLLSKFSGEKFVPDTKKKIQRSYQCQSLPPYLILLMKRFSKNNWHLEKNPTIVNFPIKNVDFGSCLKEVEDGIETKYDLVANITHEGLPGPGNGVYKAQVRSKGNEHWFEIQDLFVDEKTPQMIFLSESYIQFWERKDLNKK